MAVQPVFTKEAYEYFLPDDEDKFMTSTLAFGWVGALLDFEARPSLSRQGIEERARQQLAFLKDSTAPKMLCNDMPLFHRRFVEWYTLSYLRRRERYRQDRAVYGNDKHILDNLGAADTYFAFHYDCDVAVQEAGRDVQSMTAEERKAVIAESKTWQRP